MTLFLTGIVGLCLVTIQANLTQRGGLQDPLGGVPLQLAAQVKEGEAIKVVSQLPVVTQD